MMFKYSLKHLIGLELTMAQTSHLTLYGASWCGYCVALQEKLTSRGIEFTHKDVDEPEVRLEMNKKTDGNQTIPVLCNGNKCWVNPGENELKEILV